MPVIICMLRGVNVGGHNKIKMEELRAICGALKLRNACTFIQSGNVIFSTTERDLETLGAKIQSAIEKKFKFRPAIILRTVDELREVIAKNPFPKQAETDPGKLLVNFLAADPGNHARKQALAVDTTPQEMRLHGREAFIYFPNGQGQQKMSWPAIERILKTTATGRNWNSVTKMLVIAESLESQT
jgi:uncharacterized protein (DUF1697 family)